MARKGNRKRTRLVRSYPANTLEAAKAVAEAVGSSGAGETEGSINRNELATALGTTAKSSAFTTILNSSAKYGLTLGGYTDERIRLTSRGLSIVAPTRDNERRQALTEASLEPDVFRQFYEIHDGADLPDDTYCRNILQRNLSVHAELTGECLEIAKANGVFAGLIRDSHGKLKVDLAPVKLGKTGTHQTAARNPTPEPAPTQVYVSDEAGNSNGRVFVGHWGDPDAAKFVTKTLADFRIPFVYMEGLEPDGRPVHAKIAEEMQKSAAAILVFTESEGAKDGPLDREQMLFQLGASSVLFGDKVVVFLCSEDGAADSRSPGKLQARTVSFSRGRYDEAGYKLIRELHQSGIIRVGV
ncbi:MAG: hypothetical protein J4O08_01895 [Chloroflexi bacterium]|nr:hypothetical protein [Chloroflexota bacterium]